MSRDSLRRALRTFLQTALALLVPGLLGWLNAITEWARGEGQTPFPDARSFAYVGIVAILSGIIAAVTLLWNMIEDALGHGVLRTPPAGNPGDAGRADVLTAVLVVLVVVVVLVLIL